MNVVIDTNVFVSGLLSENGMPGKIVNMVLAERFTILFDNRIMEEYEDVLNRKKWKLSREIIDPVIDYIKNEGIYVLAEPIKIKFEDEDDKKFLEVAISGNAEFLITGNIRHYPAYEIITTPRNFFEKI
jgi:putative PIN family toxin of toxin-antitoxin system